MRQFSSLLSHLYIDEPKLDRPDALGLVLTSPKLQPTVKMTPS